jgi:hypothetical protein
MWQLTRIFLLCGNLFSLHHIVETYSHYTTMWKLTLMTSQCGNLLSLHHNVAMYSVSPPLSTVLAVLNWLLFSTVFSYQSARSADNSAPSYCLPVKTTPSYCLITRLLPSLRQYLERQSLQRYTYFDRSKDPNLQRIHVPSHYFSLLRMNILCKYRYTELHTLELHRVF